MWQADLNVLALQEVEARTKQESFSATQSPLDISLPESKPPVDSVLDTYVYGSCIFKISHPCLFWDGFIQNNTDLVVSKPFPMGPEGAIKLSTSLAMERPKIT